MVPMTRARRRHRRGVVRLGDGAARLRRHRSRARRGPRAARRRGGRQRAAATETTRRDRATLQASLLPPVLPEIPGVELAAAYRPAGEGIEVGGDFYDVFDTAERRVVAGHRRRLRQGRRGRRGDRAGALHDPRGGGAHARSPERDPALAHRRDAAPGRADGRFCTIACMRLDLSTRPGCADGLQRRPPAAAVLRRDGRVGGDRRPGHAARDGRRPGALRRGRGARAAGDLVLASPTGSPRRGRRRAIWTQADVRDVLAGAPGHTARAVVDHLVATALAGVRSPRDDVAVLALRLAG